MFLKRTTASLAGLFMAMAAHAAVPKVVTDIAPVQSLVMRIMGDRGAPDLLLPPDQSPHHFSLKPSQARALAAADLIVYIGEELIPSLAKLETSLAPNAVHLSLLDHPQTHLRDIDDEDGHDHDHDHAHDDGHDSHDPHAWLDPMNAIAWTHVIADALATLDPEYGATYRSNATALAQEISEWTARAQGQFTDRAGPFVVLHNAYGYFADRFDLDIHAALLEGEGLGLGAGHLREIQDDVQRMKIACLFTEPQLGDTPLKALAHLNLKIIELDPLGARLPVDGDLYLAILDGMARAFEGCTY